MVLFSGMLNDALNLVTANSYKKLQQGSFRRDVESIIGKTDFKSTIEKNISYEEFPDIEIRPICNFLVSEDVELIAQQIYLSQEIDVNLNEVEEDFFLLFSHHFQLDDENDEIYKEKVSTFASKLFKILIEACNTTLDKAINEGQLWALDAKEEQRFKILNENILKNRAIPEKEENIDETVTNYIKNIRCGEEKNKLNQHYTELSVLQIAVEDTFPTTIRTEDQNEPLEVSELVEKEPKLIIAGDSGSGKTTTLRWLEYKYAGRYLEENSSFVPIYIDLSLFDSGEFLDHVADIVEGKGLNKGVLEILLKEKALLLIDGLDLLSSTKDFNPYKKLLKFVVEYCKCRYVISSRHGYFERFYSSSIEIKNDFKISEIEELDRPKILKFIDKHPVTGVVADKIKKKIDDDKNLLSILKNPMMLFIAIKVASLRDKEKEILPSTRSELYKEFINYLFFHCQERGTELCADKVQILKAATDLYFYLQCRITVRCDFYKAAGIVEESSRIKGLKPVVGVDVLEDLFNLAIFKREGNSVKYGIHQSFQEYFAALKLKDLYKKGTDISPAFTHPRWEEVVKFASEMVDDSDRFVDSIIESGNLHLASRCTQNSSTGVKEKLSGLLSSKLDSRFALDRRNAIESLGRLGEYGIACLIKALSPENWSVFSDAAYALGEIGSEEAVPSLLKALSDEDMWIRTSAASALGEIGSEDAVPALINTLSDEYWFVRRYTAWALGNIGSEDAVPALIKALSDEDSSVRSNAAWALGNIGSEDAVPALITALSDEYPDVCSDASSALVKIGSEDAVPALLINALSPENWSARSYASSALGEIGSKEAVRALINALSDEDSSVRSNAAWALGKIGSEDAVPALINALSDEDSSVRSDATWALGNIGSEDAVPALITALSDEDSDVRRFAAWSLGKIGSEDAVPALITALSNEDSDVRSSAVWALGDIGSEDAVRGLITALSNEDSDVRRFAASALGKIVSEDAVPALITALSDEDSDVRHNASSALGKIVSEDAVPALITALSDENSFVRNDASLALRKIGSEDAVPALITALSDENSSVRRYAASALGEIGSEDAVPALITALSDEDRDVRSNAAWALGNIGAQDAVPALLKALSDEASYVRYRAVDALKTICNINHKEKIIPLLSSNNDSVANAAFEIIYEIDRKDASERELFTDLFSYLEE